MSYITAKAIGSYIDYERSFQRKVNFSYGTHNCFYCGGIMFDFKRKKLYSMLYHLECARKIRLLIKRFGYEFAKEKCKN